MVGRAQERESTLLADHWRWRPEWAADRPCLWWYLTFESAPSLRSLSESVQRCLHDVPAVDVVPLRWLHLTVQDVGFLDEVSTTDLDTAVAVVRETVTGQQPLQLTLGPVTAMRTAVVLAAEPVADLALFRSRVRAAMAAANLDVRGPDSFWPHVSLGYVNRESDRQAVLGSLASLVRMTTCVRVTALTLASVTRRDGHYQWTERARLPLNGRWPGADGLPA